MSHAQQCGTQSRPTWRYVCDDCGSAVATEGVFEYEREAAVAVVHLRAFPSLKNLFPGAGL